jgi:hypothetical protein
MRRFLTIAGLLLCLGAVACDPNDPKVDAANKAVDATSEMPGWFGLIGSLGGIALSAFGLRRAGVGAKYAEGGWSKEEVEELVVALRGHGYKVEKA